MTRPGVSILQRSTPPIRSAPTDTGVWYVVGLTDKGPANAPQLVRSMADFERIFGPRVSYSILYDALDVYFHEGGSRAYVSRVVGPDAVTASLNLAGSTGTSLVATAKGPGSVTLKVGVRAGVGSGTFVVFVEDGLTPSTEIETSPDLDDSGMAVVWAEGSDYITLTLGADATDPVVAAAAALTLGDDDRAAITDTEWEGALNAITTDFGVGQVSAPGRTTDVGHQQVLEHAANNRRVGILDAPDSGVQATLLTSATGARAGNQRFGGMFWPWVVVPGVVSGSTRTVPPCALVAGKIAGNDNAGLGANSPAAGENGVASYVLSLSQDPGALDREALNEGGVNVIRELYGSFRIYGWRSLVNPVSDPAWLDLGNGRLFMAISAEGAAIAESYLFDKIDGQGKTIASFTGALVGMLQGFYNTGDLYGVSPADAFFVDTGVSVNTPTTLGANELHAVLNVRMSPFAEMVEIEIYKRPIDEGVTA